MEARAGEAALLRLHGGCGKRVKHIDTPYVFIQYLLKDGIVSIHKVSTDFNPADLGTQFLTLSRIFEFLNML